MPEEAPAAPAAEAESAPSPAPADAGGQEAPNGNDWLRDSVEGSLYSRTLDTSSLRQQREDARAELRRGRRPRPPEESPSEAQRAEPEPKADERTASPREEDAGAFDRRVQAEVDRREAVRRQRAQAQQERELRQRDPKAYAQLKEQQESQQMAAGGLSDALMLMSKQFDDATVTQLMNALDDASRETVLKDPGHGLDGRKTIMKRGIEALKKLAYDEGFAKGKESAQKSLRRSTAFRRELLAELRGDEEEPELAPSNGASANGSWDMNTWMRAMTGRNGRASE